MRGAMGEHEDGDEHAGAPAWLRESWPTLLSRRATLWWYRRGDRYARHRAILARGFEYARPTPVPPLREAIALQLALRAPGAIGRVLPEWLVIVTAGALAGAITIVATGLAALAWIVRVPARAAIRLVRHAMASRSAGRALRECFVDVAPGTSIGAVLRVPGTGKEGQERSVVRVESIDRRGPCVSLLLRRVGDVDPAREWWIFLHARPDAPAGDGPASTLMFPLHHVPRLPLHRWPPGRIYRAEFDLRELGQGEFRLDAGVYDAGTHACMSTPGGAPAIDLGVVSIDRLTERPTPPRGEA